MPTTRTSPSFREVWDAHALALVRLGRVLFDDPSLNPAVDIEQLLRTIRARVSCRWEAGEVNSPSGLSRIVAGEMLAFALGLYARSLRGTISGQVWSDELIEELMQAASVRAIERLDELITRPRPLFGWLCQLVRQQRVDWLRARSALKRDAGRTVTLSAAVELAADGTTPTQAERKMRIEAMFEKVLEALPMETAKILRWHTTDHLGPAEMATRLGISAESARVRLFRARRESCETWLRLFPDAAADFQEFGISDLPGSGES